jgi:hypothetical protein
MGGPSPLLAKGNYTRMVRRTNSAGAVRPVQANWNPSGFIRNVIEATPLSRPEEDQPMSGKTLPLAPLMVAVLAPICDRAEPSIALKSVTVDLPDSARMFPGPGSDAVDNNCLACHPASMVLNQPVLPKSTWQAEAAKMIDTYAKMIHTYKAPISREDAAAIVDYLARTKAPE